MFCRNNIVLRIIIFINNNLKIRLSVYFPNRKSEWYFPQKTENQKPFFLMVVVSEVKKKEMLENQNIYYNFRFSMQKCYA